MKRFLNEGLPLETGIRAALRYHQKRVKLHKVQKLPSMLNLHQQAINVLQKMLPQDRSYVTKHALVVGRNHYLTNHLVAKPDLLGLVPADLLLPTGELDVDAARRCDVLDMILYNDEKAQ